MIDNIIDKKINYQQWFNIDMDEQKRQPVFGWRAILLLRSEKRIESEKN